MHDQKLIKKSWHNPKALGSAAATELDAFCPSKRNALRSDAARMLILPLWDI